MRSSGGKVFLARNFNETCDIPTSAALATIYLIMQLGVLPSELQSAKWGFRALKGTFRRFRLPPTAVATLRRRLLCVCVHLLNLRTSVVGLIQIETTYASDLVETSPWIKRVWQRVGRSAVRWFETEELKRCFAAPRPPARTRIALKGLYFFRCSF